MIGFFLVVGSLFCIYSIIIPCETYMSCNIENISYIRLIYIISFQYLADICDEWCF